MFCNLYGEQSELRIFFISHHYFPQSPDLGGSNSVWLWYKQSEEEFCDCDWTVVSDWLSDSSWCNNQTKVVDLCKSWYHSHPTQQDLQWLANNSPSSGGGRSGAVTALCSPNVRSSIQTWKRCFTDVRNAKSEPYIGLLFIEIRISHLKNQWTTFDQNFRWRQLVSMPVYNIARKNLNIVKHRSHVCFHCSNVDQGQMVATSES